MNSEPISHNILIIATAALALGAGGGYYTGQISAENRTAREVFGAAIPTNILSGTVARVDAEQNSLAVDVPGIYGLNFPARYRTKEVRRDEHTRIVARAPKNGETFQKELAEYRKKLKDGSVTPTPPLPHTEKIIEMKDISRGESVDFSFNPRENLTFMEKEFIALDIVVNR